MKNPYDVLGVPEGASPEQVNAAFRELSRKYQDDGSAYSQKKLEEITAAYDSIIMGSETAYSGSYTDYSDIKSKIRFGRMEDAEILLDGTPENRRDAEWYYLKGVIHQKRGWLEEATHNFARACTMDPSNNTYRMAYNKIKSSRAGGYRTERRDTSRRKSDCDACDICCGLLCLDSCCECMGGDCITCC